MSTVGEERIKRATSAGCATWAGKECDRYNSWVAKRLSVYAGLVRETLNDR